MMKTKLYIVVMILMGAVVLSCTDEEGEGVPQVTNISVVEKDSTIEEGFFGSFIAIEGKGFKGLNSVLFNGVEAKINSNFVTSSNIIVQIPDEYPDEITNTVTLVMRSGSSHDFPFSVAVPKPFLDDDNAVIYELRTETITITGGNFVKVKSVSIAGIEVSKFIVSNLRTIKFELPDEVPIEVVKIVVQAVAGSIETEFSILEASKPKILDIPAEWVDEGGTNRIIGTNLINISKIKINGTIEVTDFEVNDDFNVLDFEMPAGVDAGEMTIVLENDKGVFSDAFTSPHKTVHQLWWNYDNVNKCWANGVKGTADGVASISGEYAKFEGDINPSWWDASVMYAGCFAFKNDVIASPNDYVLKFEMNVVNPWSAGSIAVRIDTEDAETNKDEQRFEYQYKPYEGLEESEEFTTNGWVTVSLPLSNWNIDVGEPWLGNPVFRFYVPGNAAIGAKNVAIYVDNVRIDKK